MRLRPSALARTALLVALASLSCPLSAAPRDAKEKALVAHVNAQRAELDLALLEQIVNVNSGTMNFAGVRKVADMLRPRFEALGFKVHLGRRRAVRPRRPPGRERPGRGQHVLLIGHLDTVFEPNHPFQRFERVDAQHRARPGHVRHEGRHHRRPRRARRAREAEAARSSAASRWSCMAMKKTRARRSTSRAAISSKPPRRRTSRSVWRTPRTIRRPPSPRVAAPRAGVVRCKAKSAHSSQIFTDEVGAGAVYELAPHPQRLLSGSARRRVRDVQSRPGRQQHAARISTENRCARDASGKDNIVAPVAVASGDLRTLTVQQLEDTRAKMRKIVAANLPQTSAEITFTDSYPPMAADRRQSQVAVDVRRGQPRSRIRPGHRSESTQRRCRRYFLRGGSRRDGDRRPRPARRRLSHAGRVRRPAHVSDPDAAVGGVVVSAGEEVTAQDMLSVNEQTRALIWVSARTLRG